VLSGGIKLFRFAADSQRYKAAYFKHHTMLVHTSPLRGSHDSIASRLRLLWDQCAFNSPNGLAALKALWDTDQKKVCAARGDELIPGRFEELIPHLAEAIKRIELGQRMFVVVNSDNPEAPDFSASSVWKIIVGGNKLSRGYTIEGLTVSYYRRVAGTAETLMQMGRWFGFRPGYQDLVRVFLGVKDGKKEDSDLVSLFKEVCRMEERFRDELERYVRRPGAPRITPKQIPPLIAVSGSLPPTSRNKMFNAMLASKNFGGQRSMLTLTPRAPESLEKNIDTVTLLLKESKSLGTLLLGGSSQKGKPMDFTALLYQASTNDIIDFLTSFRWLETDYKYPDRPADTGLQIEFLGDEKHGIVSWLVVAPQRKISFGEPLKIDGLGTFAVKERHRVEGRGYQVFGEPQHRTIADFLSDISTGTDMLVRPNVATSKIRSPHQGVVLLYVVREKEPDIPSIGYELFFPSNQIQFDLNWTVKRKADKTQVVVSQ
jgi:hypothetical protein